MSNMRKWMIYAAVLCLVLSCFSGCGQAPAADAAVESTAAAITETAPQPLEIVDYAGSVTLDMDSDTAKLEVTVKMFIDGDTTHFYVSESVMPSGVLKARYLAINTPESTGKIEEWGKKASAFTKQKLSSAVSIILESETSSWNPDSTGDRHLCWVWYRTADSQEYRNLNIEILQNGLAIANNSSQNRYGQTCVAALNQARAQKLNVHSGEQDPDYYYGEAVELTLKELRTNIEQYNGMKVAFNGVITVNNNNGVYVESYDPETDMYYGMYVYYGYSLSSKGLEILSIGNEVRIVGSVQYYEAGGTYQVADLNYRMMKPDDPNNIQLISEGHTGAYVPTDADTFINGTVDILVNEEPVCVPYAQLAMGSSIEISNLKVMNAYTTTNEDSASQGAFTLYCQVDGIPVSVRTIVLTDANGSLVTQDRYMGKTIDVKGIVDYFNGTYQIKVFSADNIIVH